MFYVFFYFIKGHWDVVLKVKVVHDLAASSAIPLGVLAVRFVSKR